MLHTLCNKRGISMVEMLVAIVVTSIAVMSILSLQSSGWRTAAKSDHLGRAAGILYNELETREVYIMNPSNTVTIGTFGPATVLASGQAAAVEGDATFQLTTTIANISTLNPQDAVHGPWRVTVTVTWPPLNSTGVTENIVVTRQDRYNS